MTEEELIFAYRNTKEKDDEETVEEERKEPEEGEKETRGDGSQ